MYIKYKLQKKQVSHDGGVTWVDVVPLEERIGESAGTYSTLEECEHDYSTDYLTFESESNNNVISWIVGAIAGGGITAKTISASTDDGNTWTAYTSTTGGTEIATLNAGDKVLIKGENSAYGYNCVNKFVSTGKFKAYGNIMSLISGDTFENATEVSTYAFQSLFSICFLLTSAEHLILPATTLGNGCYISMFGDCTSLTVAPELPATTLANNCYRWMFAGCTNLTSAPVLPATTLADSCYYCMFERCSNLNYIKCLATDISAFNCTGSWVDFVAASGTFVKASSMTGWTTGTNGIPSNWTVQNA